MRQVRPLLWVLLVVAAFHLVVSGWERAVVVVGVIALLVLAAGLVTLTTPTQDLLDVDRPGAGAGCAGWGWIPTGSGCCSRSACGRCRW